MATVFTTIGTDVIASSDVNSVSGSNPYTITLDSPIPAGALVGDTLKIDPGGIDELWLVTGLSGSDVTVIDAFAVGASPTVDSCQFERTYASITSWEADLDDTGIYASGDDAKGVLTNDTTYNEAPVVNGGGTRGLNSRELTSVVGERHDGTSGTGARIVISSAPGIGIFSPDIASTYLSWIEIDCNDTADFTRIVAGDSQVDDRVVSHCVIHTHTVADWCFGIDLRVNSVSAGTLAIHNNIVYDLEANSTTVGHTCLGIITLANAADDTSYVYNNTVDRIVRTNSGAAGDSRGIHTTDHAGTLVKNNIVGNVEGDGTGARVAFKINAPVNSPMDYNLAEDTTAAGANSLNSKTFEDSIVSNTDGSEDYTNDITGDTYEQGVDLVDTPTDVGEDAFGIDRDGDALTWSMGASQGVPASATQKSGLLLLSMV